MKTILKLNHVWAGYSHAPIIKDLSMELSSHSLYGLLGAKGSGKSTLLRLLLSQLPLLQGELLWNEPLDAGNPPIGAVLETPRLYRHLSVREHLHLFGGYYRLPEAEAECWLKHVGLSGVSEHSLENCSVSVKQRLGLAIALMPQPRLLLLDNPTADLKGLQSQRLFQVLSRLKKEFGTSFLIATEEANILGKWADRVGILHEGKLRWEGTPNQTPNSVILTARPRTTLLVNHLIKQKELPFEWLDGERVKVQIRWQADISMLVKHLILHGIDLLGVEPQKTSIAELLCQHTEKMSA